jgi:hypothetical protein
MPRQAGSCLSSQTLGVMSQELKYSQAAAYARQFRTKCIRRSCVSHIAIAAGVVMPRELDTPQTSIAPLKGSSGSRAKIKWVDTISRLRRVSQQSFVAIAGVRCPGVQEVAERSWCPRAHSTKSQRLNCKQESFGGRVCPGRAKAMTCHASKNYRTGGHSMLTPNPSIERTRPGKPGRASHVKR